MDLKNLSVLAYAQGFTLWHYKALGDSLGRVLTFQPLPDMLRPGDQLHISAFDGAALAAVAPKGYLVVLAKSLYEATP